MMTFNNKYSKHLLLVLTFLAWTIVFALEKPFFLLLYGGLGSAGSVMVHGLPLDLSLAGYFTAPLALMLLVSTLPVASLHGQKGQQFFWLAAKLWTALAALLAAVSFTANLGLYGYWRFPLDSSPLFYISSSPADAMASVEWWQMLCGGAAIFLASLSIYGFHRLIQRRFQRAFASSSPLPSLLLLLLTASLILPIRGGVTVSSMNTGSVYFSSDETLNHAAVNPLFSLMESMSHSDRYDEQYRYMDNEEAEKLVGQMIFTAEALLNDSAHQQVVNIVSTPDSISMPDVYLLILESFSDTLMHAKSRSIRSGEMVEVTPRLNQMKAEGLWFSNFYANSYRTDRGLVAILQGYPSPATTSLMKNPRLTASMPSICEALKPLGYGADYYYGGDADFTNMRSFLIGQGFERITEDVSFPIGDRLSKWGVPDHLVFARAQQEIDKAHFNAPTTDVRFNNTNRPMLRVIQTSSSHEPFDVPYNQLEDKRLNAFAYTDSCIGAFVDHLKQTGRWERSLVIALPDHLGAWPEGAPTFATWRFHIPMIWAGGALQQTGEVKTLGSQHDLAATLMGQFHILHHSLPFSKDLFDARSPHFAFFMPNDGFGLITTEGSVVYDHKLGKAIHRQGQSKTLEAKGKAYVQRIYDDLSSRLTGKKEAIDKQ